MYYILWDWRKGLGLKTKRRNWNLIFPTSADSWVHLSQLCSISMSSWLSYRHQGSSHEQKPTNNARSRGEEIVLQMTECKVLFGIEVIKGAESWELKARRDAHFEPLGAQLAKLIPSHLHPASHSYLWSFQWGVFTQLSWFVAYLKGLHESLTRWFEVS